jgi:hypothetical protein
MAVNTAPSASVLMSLGRYGEAEAVFQQALHELQLFPHAGHGAVEFLELGLEQLDLALHVAELRRGTVGSSPPLHAARRPPERRVHQDRRYGMTAPR